MKKIATTYFDWGWIVATGIAAVTGFYAGRTHSLSLALGNIVFFIALGMTMFHFKYKR